VKGARPGRARRDGNTVKPPCALHRVRAWLLSVALAGASCCGGAWAADAAPVDAEASGAPVLRDPWVPPAVRKSATRSAPAASGAALKMQVVDKLRASFARADVEGVGTITREQARSAGLGLVAARFDAIDTADRGRIGFDDFLRYLRAQGADL
jgi:hypothetical protein